MEFNDCHVHIRIDPVLFRDKSTLQDYLNERSKNNVCSIVFLHPLVKKLYACDGRQGHLYSARDLRERRIEYVCKGCGNVSFLGDYDPFRVANEKLIRECEGVEGVQPYIYLSLTNNTINEEFLYFENNYKGKFFGIKLHPNLADRKLSEINFNSNYPLIVHTGVEDVCNAEDVVKFAKKYSGNILFAHSAAFNKEALIEIGKLKNAYIDISPTYLLDSLAEGSRGGKSFVNDINDSGDVTTILKNLIDIVGVDKILFGSDYPWGDVEKVEALYDSLKLPENIKNKIFYENYIKFNKIRENYAENE